MAEEAFNLDSLEEMSSGDMPELTQHEGARVKIDKVEVDKIPSNYDTDGNYVEGLQREVHILRVSTEVLGTFGEGLELRGSEIFNLKERDGKIGWSTHEKAKIQKLFRKLKVTSPKDLIDQTVTVTVNVRKDGREFLGFVY